MTDEHTVAVLGLGNMGSAMTDRLVATEHSVRAWTRRPTHTSPMHAEAMAGAERSCWRCMTPRHVMRSRSVRRRIRRRAGGGQHRNRVAEEAAICRRIARLGGTQYTRWCWIDR